jgi:hypothetical protein
VVATSVLAVELQEHLLAREREMDSKECTITTWEDGLAAFERTLGRVRMVCDARLIQAEAA